MKAIFCNYPAYRQAHRQIFATLRIDMAITFLGRSLQLLGARIGLASQSGELRYS